MYRLIFLLIVTLFPVACGEESADVFLPKPYGYQRISLPTPTYQRQQPQEAPYSMLISNRAEIRKDSSFMTEDYWIEVFYPEHNAELTISYKDLKGNIDSLAYYINTSLKLTNKHQIRAEAIRERVVKTNNGHTAVISELEGDVPSTYQWFVTDSVNHFLRAAMYFPSSTMNDSLAPVIQHIRADMDTMLNSVEWHATEN